METLCVYILRSSSFFNVYFFSSAKQDITFSFAFVFLVHSLVITLSVCLSSLLWHSSDSHSLSSSLFWNKQYNIVCSEVVITCVCVCLSLYVFVCVCVIRVRVCVSSEEIKQAWPPKTSKTPKAWKSYPDHRAVCMYVLSCSLRTNLSLEAI